MWTSLQKWNPTYILSFLLQSSEPHHVSPQQICSFQKSTLPLKVIGTFFVLHSRRNLYYQQSIQKNKNLLDVLLYYITNCFVCWDVGIWFFISIKNLIRSHFQYFALCPHASFTLWRNEERKVFFKRENSLQEALFWLLLVVVTKYDPSDSNWIYWYTVPLLQTGFISWFDSPFDNVSVRSVYIPSMLVAVVVYLVEITY